MGTIMHDKIAVIDFGGQYAHLIARRIRELGVLAEIIKPEETIILEEYKGYILSGGPGSVYQTSHTEVVKEILGTSKPVLGICYGHQLLAETLGGKVELSPNP
jgi:GMP synthase (glutamine-hydrolysing)